MQGSPGSMDEEEEATAERVTPDPPPPVARPVAQPFYPYRTTRATESCIAELDDDEDDELPDAGPTVTSGTAVDEADAEDSEEEIQEVGPQPDDAEPIVTGLAHRDLAAEAIAATLRLEPPAAEQPTADEAA